MQETSVWFLVWFLRWRRDKLPSPVFLGLWVNLESWEDGQVFASVWGRWLGPSDWLTKWFEVHTGGPCNFWAGESGTCKSVGKGSVELVLKLHLLGIHISVASVQFSHSVMSNSLWPHGLQHTKLPCPSPTPGACSNSGPSSRWCHPTILFSIVPFSSCLQSFPASGSYISSLVINWRSENWLQVHPVLFSGQFLNNPQHCTIPYIGGPSKSIFKSQLQYGLTHITVFNLSIKQVLTVIKCFVYWIK